MITKVKKVIAYIDPLFFYIVIAYGLGRIYQFVYNRDSVWQAFWDQIQLYLGKTIGLFQSITSNKIKFYFVKVTSQ